MSDDDQNISEKQEEVKSNQDNQEKESSRGENPEENNNEMSKENKEEGEKKEDSLEYKEKKTPFWYFEDNISEKDIQDDSIFKDVQGNYKYSICILVNKDDLKTSQALYNTLKGIEQNLKTLKEKIDIQSEQICVFIFISEIYDEYLFNENDVAKLEENIQNKKNQEIEENLEGEYKKENIFSLLMRERVFKEDNELKNIKYYTIAKNFEYKLTEVCALKAYYSILSKLYKDKKLMFSSVITEGVYPITNSLLFLMQSAYNSNQKHGVSVAPIEYSPKNLWSKISLYERLHFNIYNMSYYFESCAIPVSSLLCTMSLDKNILKFLNQYYQTKILENATIDFHDYNLGLNLIFADNGKYLLKFNNTPALGLIAKDDMSFADYQKQFIDRYSGYYGNFFQVLRSFNCGLNIIFLFFQIIAFATEYLFPSLASMVIYTVLLEAFKTTDYRIALFLTSLYLSMMFASGVCSLITKEPQKMIRSNYFLFIFMELIYALVIVCSVPAMHFANKENLEIDYTFNKTAISLIIVFTFIPYIIPFILYNGIIGNNIVPMIMYFFLGATSSTTIFNVPVVWNAPDTAGGNKVEYRKSIHIIIYLGFNLFIGGISFYMNGRKKRADCLMSLGIIFLIYNFVRTLAILIKYCSHREPFVLEENLLKNIKAKLGSEEEGDDNEEADRENIKNEKNDGNENNNGNEDNEENENNKENEENNNNGDDNNEEEKNNE